MKKLFTLLVAVFLTATVWAQSPEKMSYQAVIRDAGDALVTNTQVGMQISILQGSANGTAVYVETQTPTTNGNGLVSIEIGGGAGFSTINWANGSYFIKTETDIAGETNYTITGTSQLLSVPYALYAKTAETVSGGITENDPIFVASPANGITATNITNWTTAYGWENHATAGYLTSFNESDPIFVASPANGITAPNITNWTAAYGWGNHSGLYRPITWFPAWSDVTSKPDFATVATSGSYNDLVNKPDFSIYATKNMNNQNITNLADPVNDQDAVTKAYVDEIIDNLYIQGVLKLVDIDGNQYEVVKIGNQIWMAEDLRVTHYPNGDPIPNVTDNTAWGNLAANNTDDAYCFYNNNNTTDYGALYTYAAAIGDNWLCDNAAGQGVCPDGWQLPTDVEWITLTTYLGGTNVAGGKMKETGTTHWQSPNTGATNETSFTALPNGFRYGSSGTFSGLGYLSNWWSATESSGSNAWVRALHNNSAGTNSDYSDKSYGFSVRCVRD